MPRTTKKTTTPSNTSKTIPTVPAAEQPYQVPENWRWVRLLDTFDNLTDSKRKIQQKSYLEYGNIAVVDQGQEIVGGYTNDERISFTGNLPVIVFGDHTRCIKYVDFPFAQGADGVKVLAPRKCYYPKAFYYALINVDIPNMGYRRHYPLFKNYYIPLPPLAEQQRIVDRIERLFAKLDEAHEKAQAVVDGFENRKAAILHKAFTGELIGLSPNNITTLSKVIDSIRIGPFGSALHKEDYIIGGVPIINPKHISNQQIISEDCVTITEAKACELCSYRLKIGDIVMGRRGEMGRSAPVTSNEEGWLCGTGSLIIRLKQGYNASFYSQIIASQSSIKYLEENCVGSTMKNLNEKVVKGLPVPDFTISEQTEIVRILDALLDKERRARDLAESVIAQIDGMKKAILARAFRGELGTNVPGEAACESICNNNH